MLWEVFTSYVHLKRHNKCKENVMQVKDLEGESVCCSQSASSKAWFSSE